MRPLLDVLQDLRYGWRQLWLRPAFAGIAILTLGLGLAITTTLFTVVNAFMYKPVAGARLDGVGDVQMLGRDARGQPLNVNPSLVSFRRLETHLPDSILAITAAIHAGRPMVQVPGRAEALMATGTTAGFPHVFDVPAQAGRWFTDGDDNGPSSEPVVVISDAVWRDWFGGDRQAIDRAIVRLNGVPFRVIGVAPPRFRGLDGLRGVEIYVPLSQVVRIHPDRQRLFEAVGVVMSARAKSGSSLDRMAADLAGHLEAHRSPALTGATVSTSVRVTPVVHRLRARSVGTVVTALAGIATLVLLAACANVSNMLYARATERSGETSLRLSLGATRGRLLRQELVEAGLLAALAAGCGLVLALGASALLARVMPTFELNRYMQVALDLSPDHRVLFIALAAGLVSALLVGGLTAWHASRMVPLDGLAASSVNQGVTRRTGRTRLVLVSLQVTVAVLLALATGLLWEQVAQDFERQNVRNYHVNYDSESVVTGRIDVRLHGYEEAAGQHFFAQALDAVRAVPGIDRVALADALPGARESGPRYTMFEQFSIEPPSGPAPRQPSHFVRVSPGFFDAIGLRLHEGRDFLASDVAGAQAVAIVSASFARSLWPNEPAMGRQFTFAGELRPVTIVGVAEDPVGSADTSPLQVSHMVFLPLGQPGPGRSEAELRRGWSRNFEPSLLIVARSSTPAAVYDPIRAALRRINDDVAVQNLSSARDSLLAWLAPLRALTILMTSAGTFALGISMLGVYGVVSYFVSLRRREMAIRLALGASPRQVLALVLAHTRKTVLIGLLPGVWIGASGSRWIETTRFDLMPNEIRTWVAVPVLILIAGLAAGYVPARRASKIDPNVALRSL